MCDYKGQDEGSTCSQVGLLWIDMADYRHIVDTLAIYFGFISSILQMNNA